MPDYDIQALSLASPPSAAPVTTYRPAVRVRNNGIYPANVTGYLRIYRREPPGELLATHQLSLSSLGAGLEGNALSSGYWIPTSADVGREFLFTAHVDVASDQNPGNNDLSPVTVLVTGAEPPPPPNVLAHATQHEVGGADQIEITGLHGMAADAQTALAHKTTHQAGGADAINVDGLLGTLAQGQPIATHKETHEDGGDDQLNVDGLHGQLFNVQKPDVHDNAKHDPNFTTVTEFGNHLTDTTAVHAVATNLEQKANKGQANGYAGLAANALIPSDLLAPLPAPGPVRFLGDDQSWGHPPTAGHHESHEPGGSDEIAAAEPLAHHESHEPGGDDVIAAAAPLAHHETHEPGGTDVIAGIGALAHHESHEPGGDDEISVGGLHGQLGDLQPVAAHSTSHEVGEADELSVNGLAGQLQEAQTPVNHTSDFHDTSVEATANKGAANGYAPLDEDSLVPVDHLPPFLPGAHKTSHENGGTDELAVSGLSGVLADRQTPAVHGPADHLNALTSTPTSPGFAGGPGTAGTVPRGDHTHDSPGVIAWRLERVQADPLNQIEHLLLEATVPNGSSTTGRIIRLSGRGWFSLFLGNPNDWTLRLRAGVDTSLDNPVVLELTMFIPSGATDSALPFSYDFILSARSATSWMVDAHVIFDDVLQPIPPPTIVRFSGTSPENPRPFAVNNTMALNLSVSAVMLTGTPAVVLFQERATAERLQ